MGRFGLHSSFSRQFQKNVYVHFKLDNGQTIYARFTVNKKDYAHISLKDNHYSALVLPNTITSSMANAVLHPPTRKMTKSKRIRKKKFTERIKNCFFEQVSTCNAALLANQTKVVEAEFESAHVKIQQFKNSISLMNHRAGKSEEQQRLGEQSKHWPITFSNFNAA